MDTELSDLAEQLREAAYGAGYKRAIFDICTYLQGRIPNHVILGVMENNPPPTKTNRGNPPLNPQTHADKGEPL